MDFVKMEGLGNDFVVLEGPRSVSADQVERWCERRRGIGADGVLVASPLDPRRVGMEYWNADGSAAEMCGNGLRCVARFAHERGWTEGALFVVESAVGEHPVEVRADGTVRAFLGPVGEPDGELEVAGTAVRPVRVGNPHAVVMVDDPTRAAVAELGPRIEGSFPGGANVEFATVREPDLLEVRVWERGVGETLACGTGAAAAAVVAHRSGAVGDRLTVRLPGGLLGVEVAPEGVWITGPARRVFEGRWDDANAS